MSITDETILGEELQTTDSSSEWEQKYKELQADYTRKSQELAQFKKATEQTSSWYDETELANFRALMAQEGYVKKDEVESVKSQIRQEQEFERLIDSDPELKRLAPAIMKLAKAEWKSYEDVIEENWFLSSSKLAKAKERSLMGDRVLESKPKTIADMSDEEWNEYEASLKANKKSFTSL